MMSGIGLPEILIVLVIALVVLGPKRLPDAGRSLGRGLREFKGAISGSDHDDDRDDADSPVRAAAAVPAHTETTRPA
jgi:sec-independent protein translocase protein TatA